MLRIWAVYHLCKWDGYSLRVYSRDNSKSHSNVAFEPTLKKQLKEIGFEWDKSNKSFFINAPSKDVINKTKELVEFTEE